MYNSYIVVIVRVFRISKINYLSLPTTCIFNEYKQFQPDFSICAHLGFLNAY